MFIISLVIIILRIRDLRAQRDCYYDGNEFCLNQEDILSVDLLPGSFLFMNPTSKGKNHLEEYNNITVDGSMDRALDEMDFHRKRMNEYLCHGFIAEEIFKEMKSTRVKRGPDDRAARGNSLPEFLGDPNVKYENDNGNKIDTENENDNVTVHNKLLWDEGSTKYKDWLQRTTTLDDVYRHYVPQKKIRKKVSIRRPLHSSSIIQEHGIAEFDGEVTGFAMPAAVGPDKTGPYYDSPEDTYSSPTGHNYHHTEYEHYAPYLHHEIMPIIHEEHYYPSHYEEEEEEEEEHWHRGSYKGKGELSIKDFFEITLTALAFLAFGLFIIQLLMNITNANATTAATVVNEGDNNRFKRDVYATKPMYYTGNEELNELSHRVLRSIEAALVAEQDAGRCLRWSLCTDNRHSRTTSGPRKIWLPMWSLGMSWVSGRVLSRRAWPAMLESVKAAVLGLGGADCSTIYPDCDLTRERVKRRRRRRK